MSDLPNPKWCKQCGTLLDEDGKCWRAPHSYERIEHLHVVPKADVDRVFEVLKTHFKQLPYTHETGKLLQRLRGIAYANTFLATRTIIIVEDDHEAPG